MTPILYCPGCESGRPVSDFRPDRTRATGYAPRCRPCQNRHKKLKDRAKERRPMQHGCHS